MGNNVPYKFITSYLLSFVFPRSFPAILRALEECNKRDIQVVRIFTDSNYVKQGINSWIINWRKNGWKTAKGAPVKNKELWEAIDEARKQLQIVEWRWVKAHNGHPQNEAVDRLARECAKNIDLQ